MWSVHVITGMDVSHFIVSPATLFIMHKMTFGWDGYRYRSVQSYEDEQHTLTEKAKALHAELDKSSGHRTQQIHIVYNFIGILPTPQTKKEAAQPPDYATSSR